MRRRAWRARHLASDGSGGIENADCRTSAARPAGYGLALRRLLRLRPIPRDSGFRREGYLIWCASATRVDGTYHIPASRWPESTGDPGDSHGNLAGYRIHSDVVRAKADAPAEPNAFQEVVLAGRCAGYLGGVGCHGPKIVKVGERFVLYYHGIARDSPLRKLGYSTCPWYNVNASIVLLDSTGWFAQLQQSARQPCPEELRRAIVARSHPILRNTASSHRYQIAGAVRRGDLASLNHRVAALVVASILSSPWIEHSTLARNG